MKNKAILFALTLVAAALAGCADEPAGDTTTTPTPATTTPAATPTATPSPDLAPPGENETEEDMAPLDCDPPAASTAAPGDVLGYPEYVFTVDEPDADDPCFGFVAPETIPAGWTAITLQNNGMQPHIMPMYRIEGDARTRADILAALTGDAPPEWLTPIGGVGVATPFSSGTSVLNLTEGQYLVICYFGGHHMQGMYRLVNVTAPEEEPTATEPTANATVVLEDFSFSVPTLVPGRQIIAFHNNGTQPHEAPLIRLQGNATIQQFLEAVESETPTGPPPGAGIGGVNELAPGATAYAIVDLTAGEYGFVCFVSSPEHDGAPHVALGMVTQFTVGATADTDADDGETGTNETS